MNILNEFVKSKMKKIAQKVKEELPNGYGFVVLTFNFEEREDGEMMYVSNANRQDIVEAMKEWISKTENNFGNDTGKY